MSMSLAQTVVDYLLSNFAGRGPVEATKTISASQSQPLVFRARQFLENKSVVAVDLDGTLARSVPGKFSKHKIGEPIPEMVKKVKAAIKAGKKVVIFTARAAEKGNIPPIKKWLKDNDLPDLEISATKIPEFTEFWDDRAKRVKQNTGAFQ